MIRTLVRVPLILLALTLLTAPPARAASTNVPGGRVYLPSVVTSTSSCVDIPVRWDLSALPETYTWIIHAGAGSLGTVEAGGDGPAVSHSTIVWCEDDGPGQFALRGTIIVRDERADTWTDDIALPFTVRKMATRATLRSTRKNPEVGQKFSLKGCVTAGKHRQEYRKATFQYRWTGENWRTLRSVYTDNAGCFSELAFITRAETVWLRVRVPGDGISKTGYSKEITVRAHD